MPARLLNGRRLASAVALTTVAVLAACSSTTAEQPSASATSAAAASSAPAAAPTGTVRLLAHDSFSVSKDLIADFDVFCLASEFEGMSNSLMEAMAAGIPCLASDIPPNRELIDHEKTGLIFPVGDGPAIARSALRYLNDHDFNHSIGQAGQEFIRNHHSIGALVQNHCDLYRGLLNR